MLIQITNCISQTIMNYECSIKYLRIPYSANFSWDATTMKTSKTEPSHLLLHILKLKFTIVQYMHTTLIKLTQMLSHSTGQYRIW